MRYHDIVTVRGGLAARGIRLLSTIVVVVAAALTVTAFNTAGTDLERAAKECVGTVSLANDSRSRIDWRVECSEGAWAMTIWIKRRSGSNQKERWPIGFARAVRVTGVGTQGSGSCSGNRIRAIVTCRTYRNGQVTFDGWVKVDQGGRCASALLLSRSLEDAEQRPSVLVPASQRLFTGLPLGCA